MQDGIRAILGAAVLVAGASAVFTGARPAAAQDASGARFAPPVGLAEAFQPDVLRRDVQMIDEHFALDKDQSVILDVLYSDYQTEFQRGADEARAKLVDLQPTDAQEQRLRREQHRAMRRKLEEMVARIQELQDLETPDAEELRERLTEEVKQLKLQMREGGAAAVDVDVMREVMDRFNDVIAAWEQRKRALHEQFLADVQSILTDEQRGQWPAFERKLRRVKTLGDGRLSGESVDLLRLTSEMSLTGAQRDATGPVLDEFAIELDEALKSRNAFLDRAERDKAILLTTGDLQQARSLINEEIGHRVAVRDVISRYLDALAEQLGGSAAAQLRRAYEQQAYPRVFRKTWAERSFDAIRQVPDLNSDARAAVEQIAAEYEQAIEQGRAELIGLIRQYEPQQMRDRFLQQVARAAGREPELDENPMVQAFQDLRERDQQYVDRALAVLNEQQVQSLPGFVLPDVPQEGDGRTADTGRRPRPFQLTPEQRQALARQFDADGDGRLNPEERAKLRAELLRRREAARGGDDGG